MITLEEYYARMEDIDPNTGREWNPLSSEEILSLESLRRSQGPEGLWIFTLGFRE